MQRLKEIAAEYERKSRHIDEGNLKLTLELRSSKENAAEWQRMFREIEEYNQKWKAELRS